MKSHWTTWMTIVWLLVFILMACSAPTPGEPVMITMGGKGTEEVHTLIALQGDVAVKHNEWRAPAPATFGTTLLAGDTLALAPNAHATVVCSDLATIVELSANNAAQTICAKGKEPSLYKGKPVNPPRGIEPGIPAVLAPRGGAAFSHPMLRLAQTDTILTAWLSLSSGDEMMWTEVIEPGAVNVRYPDDKPPLQPGKTYDTSLLIIKQDKSKMELTQDRFWVLSAEDEARVQNTVASVHSLQLNAPPTRLLLARLYQGKELYAEAIDVLEATATNEPLQPAELRLLGDLYTQVGYTNRASDLYRDVLEQLSPDDNDREGIAWCHLMLGKTAQTQDDVRDHLQQARTFYANVGDDEKTSEIDRLLDRL